MKETRFERENRLGRILKSKLASRERPKWGRCTEYVRYSLVSLVVLGAFALFAFVIDLFFLPRETTYSLNVVTQVLEFTVDDLSGVAASFPEVRVTGETSQRNASHKAETTYLKAILDVRNLTRLKLERKADGELYIQFDDSEAVREFATLSDGIEGSKVSLRPGASLRVIFDSDESSSKVRKSPETSLLPLRGRLQIGRVVRPMGEHILLEGKVSVFEKDPIFGYSYIAREISMEPGDVLRMNPDAKGNSLEPFHGFAQIGIGQAIRVVGHTRDRLQATRGTLPFRLIPSPWDRFARDPVLIQMSGFLALLAGLITVFEVLHVTFVRSKNHD